MSVATGATAEDTQFDTVMKELEVYSEGRVVGNHCCSKYMLCEPMGLCELTGLCGM